MKKIISRILLSLLLMSTFADTQAASNLSVSQCASAIFQGVCEGLKDPETRVYLAIAGGFLTILGVQKCTQTSRALREEMVCEFSEEKTRKRCTEESVGNIVVSTFVDEPIIPLISFTPQERATFCEDFSLIAWFASTLRQGKRMALYKRYANALRGHGAWNTHGITQHIGGEGLVTIYDTMQNGCNLVSPTLFDNMRRIINDEFMPQVEAKGKKLKLTNKEYLLHKLEAATIAVETARECFSIEELESKHVKNMSAEEIATFEQQLLTEFRAALTQKLAPFMN